MQGEGVTIGCAKTRCKRKKKLSSIVVASPVAVVGKGMETDPGRLPDGPFSVLDV